MLNAATSTLESAYSTHRLPLLRWLVARTRDSVAAEDVTQEAFVRLARELVEGRAPRDPGAWLHQVAANLVTSSGRRAQVADRNEYRLPLPPAMPCPETGALEDERRRELRVALETLPAIDRQALILAAHGYNGAEIAARIGRTEGATRTLICRARTRIRVELLRAGIDNE